MTAAIARHSMNPKNQSILHSLTTVDILLINRIDGPHYAASAAPGLRITSPLTSNTWQHRKRFKTKPQNKIYSSLVEIHSAACSCWHRLQQSGKVPGRKRTERVYAASYQSNMRRNDTIQSVAHVTNGFDLAVATPLFPHGVNNGSRRKRREYYDDFNR